MTQAREAARVDAGFWRGRRVLITGHTGFKGSWLALWLQSLGAEVHGLSDGVPTQPSLYELASVAGGMAAERVADVRDGEAVRQALSRDEPEVVLHLAAQPLVRRSFAQPRETFDTNVMGTVNVLEAARGSSVRAVLVITSDKCYENLGVDRAYREDDPLGGHDPYSASKAAAELVTAAYRRSFFGSADGPRLASARAGNVIGGGDWGEERLIPDVVRAIERGTQLEVRNPAATRPWQHVLNPLSGYLLLAQALCRDPEVAGAWNFGPPAADARPVSWIVEELSRRWPGRLGWAHDQAHHPHEAAFLKLDASMARERLGWRPPVSLPQALDSIVAWHGAHWSGEDMRSVTLGQINTLIPG